MTKNQTSKITKNDKIGGPAGSLMSKSFNLVSHVTHYMDYVICSVQERSEVWQAGKVVEAYFDELFAIYLPEFDKKTDDDSVARLKDRHAPAKRQRTDSPVLHIR